MRVPESPPHFLPLNFLPEHSSALSRLDGITLNTCQLPGLKPLPLLPLTSFQRISKILLKALHGIILSLYNFKQNDVRIYNMEFKNLNKKKKVSNTTKTQGLCKIQGGTFYRRSIFYDFSKFSFSRKLNRHNGRILSQ